MRETTKLPLNVSSSASYDDNSENINELNKPVIKRQKDRLAIKARRVPHRNRHEFGISPVSLSSANASASNGKEYETITSILAAAAYMGSADASSQGSNTDSPASTSDLSYASIKERINRSRLNVMADPSPLSVQSSPFGSVQASPKLSLNTMTSAPLPPSSSSMKPLVPLNPPVFSDNDPKNVAESKLSIHSSRGTSSSHVASLDQQPKASQYEPSPSAQTTESIITSWSVDAISPKNVNLQPGDDNQDNLKSERTFHNSHSMNLLLDDEGSKDFEIDLNSQGTFDYDEIIVQHMRYPRIVEVETTQIVQPLVTSTSQCSTQPKETIHRPFQRNLHLPPPSPRPTTRITWNDPVLQQNLEFNSPLFPQDEESPHSVSIQPPIHSLCLDSNNAKNVPPTDEVFKSFLEAAISPTITIAQLRSILSSQGKLAACQKDSYGRYPLHILSSNYELVLPLLRSTYFMQGSQNDEGTLTLNTERMKSMIQNTRSMDMIQLEDLLFELIRLNPKALITPDLNGIIPFTASIHEWIHQCNIASDRKLVMSAQADSKNILDESGLNSTAMQNRFDVEHGLSSTAVFENSDKLLKSIQSDDFSIRSKPSVLNKLSFINHRLYQSMKTPYKKNNIPGSIDLFKTNRFEEEEDSRSDAACHMGNKCPLMNDEKSTACFKVDCDITIHVEWSLQILSRILSLLIEQNVFLEYDDDLHTLLIPFSDDLGGFKAKFISMISSIPSLMKILILKTNVFVQNTPDLSYIPIFEALINTDDSIGSWIVFMLEAVDCDVVSRCINYFECLSTLRDLRSSCRPSEASVKDNIMRICHKISTLNFLLPATLSIDNLDDIHRAVSTFVMKFSVDQELRTQSSMIVVLLDFLFRVLLIVSFQLLSNRLISHGYHHASYIVPFYLCLTSIFYGLFRLFSRMISTFKVSFSAYKHNIGSFYDWIERFSLAVSLTVTIWIDKVQNNQSYIVSDKLTYLISITTLCIWVRLLTWFYVMNPSANIFFRALGKIIWDLRWLWISFTSAILAFSQVFFISFSNTGSCSDNHGFCNPNDAYLHSYSIILGSFHLNVFPNIFTKFLFVSFTMIVSILLFNVLIAMTVQSYRNTLDNVKSMASSSTRLSYVTDIRAFSRLFTARWTVVKTMSFGLFILCSVFLFYAASSSTRRMIAKAFDVQILLATITALIAIALLSCIVFLAQISFIETSEEQIGEKRDSLFHRTIGTIFYPWRLIALALVGTSMDPESWFKDELGNQKVGTVDLGNIKDEMCRMNQRTSDKLDKVYEILSTLQAKELQTLYK